MNTITRWNPLRELEDFQSRILSAFNPGLGRHGQDSPVMTEWMPLVDIAENENEYVITSELPEVRKDDVKVTVENGMLTITGERKFEKEEKNKTYHLIERSYGNFTRSFVLPEDCDPGKVNAEFKDGLLKVRVTKNEQAKPRHIDVLVS